jgi:hypothetical protein
LRLDLDGLVTEVATRVAALLAQQMASEATSSMMATDRAIASTRIPAGISRKWAAAGRTPAHGGRREPPKCGGSQ